MAVVSISDLAEKLGTEPQKLRKFLRANFPRGDKGKKYQWNEGEYELGDIEAAWKKTGGSSPRTGARKAKKKQAQQSGWANWEGPPAVEIVPCTWCSGEMNLVEVYVRHLPEYDDDQKIALYECLNCNVTRDYILTLPGWTAPESLIKSLEEAE